MTEDDQARAVMEGLLGVAYCPACGHPMQNALVGKVKTFRAWFCECAGCQVILVDMSGHRVQL